MPGKWKMEFEVEISKFYRALYVVYLGKNWFRGCKRVLSRLYECHFGGIWRQYGGCLHLDLIWGLYRWYMDVISGLFPCNLLFTGILHVISRPLFYKCTTFYCMSNKCTGNCPILVLLDEAVATKKPRYWRQTVQCSGSYSPDELCSCRKLSARSHSICVPCRPFKVTGKWHHDTQTA